MRLPRSWTPIVIALLIPCIFTLICDIGAFPWLCAIFALLAGLGAASVFKGVSAHEQLRAWFGLVRGLCLAFLIVSSGAQAVGQAFGADPAGTVATGIPNFSTVTTGPDNINLGNLNGSWTFSVLDKPGRGLPYNLSLSYDTSVWKTMDNAFFYPVNNWGWSWVSAAVPQGSIQVLVTSKTSCGGGGQNLFTLEYSSWYYNDSSGISHAFSNAFYEINGCTEARTSSGAVAASDGSGYLLNPSSPTTASVTTPSGSILNVSSLGGTDAITDRNGNALSGGGTPLGIQDTLGMNPGSLNSPSSTFFSPAIPPAGTTAAPLSAAYSYLDSTGATRTVTLNYGVYTVQTAFGCSGISDFGPLAVNLVSSLSYPDGSSDTFTYEPTPGTSNGNVTGRLQSITLRTGGVITYSYTGNNDGILCNLNDISTLGLTRKDQDGTTTYVRTNISGTEWKTVVTYPPDTITGQSNQTDVFFQTIRTGPNRTQYYETKREVFQGPDTGAPLQTVHTCYNGATPDCTATSLQLPFTEIMELTQLPNGLQKQTTTFKTAAGLTTESDEYDYGSGAPGPLLRKTLTQYASLGNNILDRPFTVTVQDGSGNQLAQTKYAYDEVAPDPTSGVPNHLAVTGSRGNATTVQHWLNTTGGFLATSNEYDDTGNLVATKDPLSNKTQFSYADNFSDGVNRNSLAYVTMATLPDTGSPTAVHHVTSAKYEPNTGRKVSSIDQDGNEADYTYDLLVRPLTFTLPPDPSGNRPQTTLSYPDPNTVTQQKTVTTSLTDTTTAELDGLGRLVHLLHATPNGTATTDATYDSLGRLLMQSNPYFSTSDPTYGVVQTQYDALGRAIKTTGQDGSISSAAYDVYAPSGVAGNCAVSTDEAGNSRRACSDGLGRLVEVDEPGDPIVNFNGAAAPATAIYSMTGFPDSYGEHDMYVGTDGHVYQLYLSPSGWVNQDLTASTGGETATAHSALTSFTDSSGEHVLYVGANQHIYQLYFNDSSWQDQDLTSMAGNTLAATGTGLSSFADGAGEHVLYIGTNQHVYELLYSSSSGWQNEDLTSQTGNTLAASNTGFTNFADSSGEHVFYEGANQHIEQLYGVEGSWQNQDLTGATGNTLAAAPTALSGFADNYGEHAFYFGSNQHVEQLYFNGSSWQNYDLTAMTGNTVAAVGSSLSSFSDYMGEHAFYEGTNQHIYSLYFSSSSGWSNNDLTAMAGGAGGVNNGSLASYSDGQGEHVFYQAGTGVYELSWDGPAWEAANIGGPSLGQNYFVTQYSYDGLGNLLKVTQKGDPNVASSSQYRMRNFTYDSVSRLLTATNPESGTISYSYDANGNVLQKTSPAPNQTGAATQTLSYCYDALNRVTGKAYSQQSCANGQLPAGTAVVSYSYDSGANGISHLTGLADQAGSGSYSYDALGRISTEQRTIAGIQKNLSYTYNLDNSVATLTYPSGAVVTYTPDSAGRALSAVDSGNNINYVTGASYGPDNSLTGFVSGNSSSFSGINNRWQYNPRLHICRITAQTTGNAPASCTDSSHTGNVLDLGYNLNAGNGDNGNVIGITNYKDSTRSQGFTYDALNRLTSAQNAGSNCSTTTPAGAPEYWGNNYSYDAWGNLLSKSVTKCSAESLTVTALPNNQLSGYGYDSAGNMTHDVTTGNNYSFDAENRITGAAGYSYTYDADGNRVEKSNGSTGTIYWYMTPGIVAESDLQGNLKSEYVFFNKKRVARRDFPSGTVSYYFSDSLKTADVITDSAGNIKSESDYYPFGGELQLASNDPNKYKFTGAERDSETGLDHMGRRYYSNALSRFTTPDPLIVQKQKLLDPQQWNMYQYARDNPLRFSDPSGLYVCSGNSDQCGKIRTALSDLQKAADTLSKGNDQQKKEAAALNKVIKFYGAEGKNNGVNVEFGNLNGKAEANTGTKTSFFGHKTTTITFDLNEVHKDFNGGGRNEEGETAAIAAHEGQHGIDQKAGLPQGGLTNTTAEESRGFTTGQGYVSEGLGFKSAYGIWDPSWPADKADSLRDAAINKNAADAAKEECAPQNGGCN